MVRQETIDWDKLPIVERLNRVATLAHRFGLPDEWYWRDIPEKGHELVLLWHSRQNSESAHGVTGDRPQQSY